MSTSDYAPDQLDGVLSARCGQCPRYCENCEQRLDLCRCGCRQKQQEQQARDAGNL